MVAHSDSDRAGCRLMRSSTSRAIPFRRRQVLKMACSTQAPLALSSGESERCAQTHAASALTWMRHLARDVGRYLEAHLAGGANVAAGMTT